MMNQSIKFLVTSQTQATKSYRKTQKTTKAQYHSKAISKLKLSNHRLADILRDYQNFRVVLILSMKCKMTQYQRMCRQKKSQNLSLKLTIQSKTIH